MKRSIKDRIRRYIFNLFKREILATYDRPNVIRKQESMVPVKLAYQFETDPMQGLNTASYPLAQEHSYNVQLERAKRELFKSVMQHAEVTVEPVFYGKPGVTRCTLSLFVCVPKTDKPVSYDKNPR